MRRQAGALAVLVLTGLSTVPAHAVTYRLETTIVSTFWGAPLGNSAQFLFDLTFDPATPATVTDIATFRRGVFDPTVAGSTGLGGTISINGQTGNLEYATASLFENKTRSQDSVSLGFVIDPAPFNDTPGNFLADDDQDDGFDFYFDVNAVRLSWGGDSSLLAGVATMPSDLLFLNGLPFSLQIEVFGHSSNYGSLFRIQSFNVTSGTWTQVAAVPLPAALPLLATALGGFGFVSWRGRRTGSKSHGAERIS